MDDDKNVSTPQPGSRGSSASLKAQIRTMPKWHKLVLSLGLLCASLGAAGWVTGKVAQRSVDEAAAGAGGASVPQGSSNFLRSTDPARRADAAPDVAGTEPEQGFVLRISPKVMRVGVSLLVGFIVGFLFRMFVKTMLLVTLVIGGIFFALTYFNVVNVDLTSAQQTYDGAREWLTDQATRLKDVVLAHLPSSASGGVGAFIGFRRR
jgi:uncharacterized membrane protein (Fun14 family)